MSWPKDKMVEVHSDRGQSEGDGWTHKVTELLDCWGTLDADLLAHWSIPWVDLQLITGEKYFAIINNKMWDIASIASSKLPIPGY